MKIFSKRTVSILETYGMYLITGMVCVCVGSSLSSLMEHFQVDLAKAAALTSAFALGRVATVFIAGIITERLGPRFSVIAGVTAIVLCAGGLPVQTNYTVALVLMALAGFGMGVQDSACPVLIHNLYPNHYSSAMSAGQAFFGAGCFLPPFIMSILLSTGHSWKWLYFTIFFLGIIMLIGIPFMGKASIQGEKETGSINTAGAGNKRIGLFLLLLVVVFIYCANSNIFHTYTVSYITHYIGREEVAVNVLTLYAVGVMLGSLLFIIVLKKIHTTTAIAFNTFAVAILLFTAMQLKSTVGFMILFTFIGMFNGALFSILVTASTEFIPNHAAMAASMIGFVGGIADIGSPLITGSLVNRTDITKAFSFNLVLVIITFFAAFLLRISYQYMKRRKII